jgi:ACT domain-containing protein
MSHVTMEWIAGWIQKTPVWYKESTVILGCDTCVLTSFLLFYDTIRIKIIALNGKLKDELQSISKEVVVILRYYTDICLENRENLSIPVRIQTEHLLNMSLKCYLYANLLSDV